MLEKDKFLEKIKLITLIICLFFFTKISLANSLEVELINYNKSLENSSATFIQTDGETIEEGVVYIGSNRIKINYEKPEKITVILSKRKGMYINHELKEVQYFNTNKSFVSVFFKIFKNENFLKKSNLEKANNTIVVKNKFQTNSGLNNIKIIYENNPVKLRKIIIEEEGRDFEIGFFNHSSFKSFNKKFFSLINPYLKD